MSSPKLPSPSTVVPSRLPLTELIGNFAYSTTSTSPPHLPDGPATKKRRITLAEEATKPLKHPTTSRRADEVRQAPRTSTKALKQKPQTITALATKAYQPETVSAAPTTVSKFFSPSTGTTEAQASNGGTEEPAKKSRKRRAKAIAANGGDISAITAVERPRKTRKRVRIAASEHLPPLCSPTQAREQEAAQSFLFGTSSQMVLEESPTFIRQIQYSLNESEVIAAATQQVSPAKTSCAKVPTAPHGTALSIGQAEKEHWCAAARDWNGGLLREKSGLKQRPKPVVTEERRRDSAIAPAPPAEPERTKENTTATRNQQSAAHEPITITSSPVPANVLSAPHTTPVPATLATGAAKNRKDSKQSDFSPRDSGFVNIDDIEDHNPPAAPTPSPPRRKASDPPTTLAPLNSPRPIIMTIASERPPNKVVTTTDAVVEKVPTAKTALTSSAYLKATDAQWLTLRLDLFKRVTAAIKSCPRSTDPLHPSWHQKILLYDPIEFEDLTVYLNNQGLRVHVERIRAKKKGRKLKAKEAGGVSEAAAETEVVQEELQAWMVRKWCEEKSICCLWKTELRNGVRSRY